MRDADVVENVRQSQASLRRRENSLDREYLGLNLR
jgi:hypothetical protein